MFFSQLQKSSNPNHPSNSEKNTVKLSKKAEPPSSGRIQKKSTKKSSKPSTPSRSHASSPSKDHKKTYKSPVSSGESSIAATPEPVVDTTRELFSEPFSDGKDSTKVITVSDLITGKTHKPIFEGKNIEFNIKLPYGEERYTASEPIKDDEFNVLDEIETVMERVGELTRDSLGTIKDPHMKDCIIRRMRKSVRNKDSEAFLESIGEFNELVDQARKNNEFRDVIKEKQRLDIGFITDILNQVYSRVVSPRANDLRNYRAFSNNVYGELLPRFATRVFNQTRMTSESVFMDLGSGVGNCVLQAALEIGCESIGCEMMKTASELAEAQKHEFEGRVAKYGIRLGEITLRSSDFTQDPLILKKLSQADVILVNNYAFDDELNGSLVNMFLDLKEGCKIISLKTFVPQDHVISMHNIHSPLNILKVDKYHFPTNSVSWTNAGGVYYISTVDRSRIANYV